MKPTCNSIFSAAFAALVIMWTSGCAIRYYDKETETEHLVGIGHMKLKVNVATNNLTSVVNGTQTFGVNAGIGEDYYGVGLGWENRRRILVMPDSVVLYEWPTLINSFFTVTISSNLPSRWIKFNRTNQTIPIQQ